MDFSVTLSFTLSRSSDRLLSEDRESVKSLSEDRESVKLRVTEKSMCRL